MLPFIVSGDFNIGLNRQNQLVSNYQIVMAANNFVLGVCETSRVTQTTLSCLDQFIHQNIFNCKTGIATSQLLITTPIRLSWAIIKELKERQPFFRDTSFLENPVLLKKSTDSSLKN